MSPSHPFARRRGYGHCKDTKKFLYLNTFVQKNSKKRLKDLGGMEIIPNFATWKKKPGRATMCGTVASVWWWAIRPCRLVSFTLLNTFAQKSNRLQRKRLGTGTHKQRYDDGGRTKNVKQAIFYLNNLEYSKILRIFAASKGEFAERMTTFMACKGRFEPQI